MEAEFLNELLSTRVIDSRFTVDDYDSYGAYIRDCDDPLFRDLLKPFHICFDYDDDTNSLLWMVSRKGVQEMNGYVVIDTTDNEHVTMDLSQPLSEIAEYDVSVTMMQGFLENKDVEALGEHHYVCGDELYDLNNMKTKSGKYIYFRFLKV
jgi:hypothetical protein